MRRALAVLLLILVTSGAVAQQPDPALAFEAFVVEAERTTHSSTPTYLNSQLTKWAKRRFHVTNLKYDVRKTESLLTPIVGTASFTLRVSQTTLVSTKEEAEALTDFVMSRLPPFQVELTFAYRNAHWRFVEGQSQIEVAGMPKVKQQITLESMNAEPNAVLNAALIYWLPK